MPAPAVTRGRGHVLVSATGPETEIGQIETLAAGAKAPPTPLARRLGRLARQMVVAGVVITVLLSAAMLMRGEPLHEAFLVGVAVAVAAVPEGLAAIVTAALALGARAMARRGAIVRRLEAIETLGETSVICTDKTGTLTENSIRLAAMRPAAGVDERDLLAAALLASSVDDGVASDPVEQALVLAAMERGLTRDELLGDRRVLRELPFDSDRKRMTVVYDEVGMSRAFMKGAPEVVAARAAPDQELLAVADGWAGEGFSGAGRRDARACFPRRRRRERARAAWRGRLARPVARDCCGVGRGGTGGRHSRAHADRRPSGHGPHDRARARSR